MMEPRRLLDGATGLDRAVLESAADDTPSPERRQRILAAFGGSSLTVLASAETAKQLAGWKLTAWKIVVGVAVTTGIGIGVAALSDRPSTSSAHSTTSAPVPAAARPPVAPATSVASPAATASAAPPSASSARTAQTRPRTQRPAPPSIAREIELIDRARSSLATGDPETALSVLHEYGVECRGGAMAVEAEVLRIEALAAAGDHHAAAERANIFLEKHPRSAYDARVRAHVTNP